MAQTSSGVAADGDRIEGAGRRVSDAPVSLDAAPWRVACVALVVRDLDRVAAFYEDAIGLTPLSRGPGLVRLGVGDAVLLELRHDPAARPWSPREAGLFHTAFLLPSRTDLGAWLAHAAARGLRLSGASDHCVSEAVYLADPEGNGIEVYADRPSAAWPRAADGALIMRSDPLDRDGLLRAATGPWAGMPEGGCVGHVHLQAGALEPAERFYAGLLGFDVTCRYPGAVFLGAGGYHHQLAVNVWNSRGAPQREPSTTGLAQVVLHAAPAALARSRDRLRATGLEIGPGEAPTVRDPSGTRLHIAPAPGSTGA